MANSEKKENYKQSFLERIIKLDRDELLEELLINYLGIEK